MAKKQKGSKRCDHCRKWKPLDEFGTAKGAPDGRKSKCRVCVAELAKFKGVRTLGPKGITSSTAGYGGKWTGRVHGSYGGGKRS